MKQLTPIAEDRERVRRVQNALADSWFTALICSLPKHVLLLTGYWPVIGTSIAIVVKGGPTYLIVPQDEEQLARKGHADQLLTFRPASLDRLTTAAEEVREALSSVLETIHLPASAIGADIGDHVEPASYAATHFYGHSLQMLVRELAPDCHLHSAEDLLAQMQASLTGAELERVGGRARLGGEPARDGVAAIQKVQTHVGE